MYKKQFTATLLALSMLVSSLPFTSAHAADEYFHCGFESSLESWEGRGDARVALSRAKAFSGEQSAEVTTRTGAWNGICKSLDSTTFSPGTTYSFCAMVLCNTTMHFQLTLQYTDASGQTAYDAVAEKDAGGWEWTLLANSQYTIPSGASNLVLYIETADSTDDFYVDELIAAKGGTVLNPQGKVASSLAGDVNQDKVLDIRDAYALRSYLLNLQKDGDTFSGTAADFDGDGTISAIDLTLLKRALLFPKPETTTTTTTTTLPNIGKTPTEYMADVRKTVTLNVPGSATGTPAQKGTVTHITYYSKFAERDKGANVWLPAGYSENKQYPVVYCNHGIMGSENDMLGMKVPEIAANLIASGEAPEMIIVFPQMYTSKTSAQASGINIESCQGYDDFVYDISESLMPYMSEHYSVKTGRENTAICGFSMGGRESLYIGVVRNDLFGFIGCAAPAPGVTPGQDMFMNHPGSMQESELKITGVKPYLLMIFGGTNDQVVGTFPEQYHNILTRNSEDHVWVSVPGAGHDGSTVTPLMYNFLRNIFKQ